MFCKCYQAYPKLKLVKFNSKIHLWSKSLINSLIIKIIITNLKIDFLFYFIIYILSFIFYHSFVIFVIHITLYYSKSFLLIFYLIIYNKFVLFN